MATSRSTRVKDQGPEEPTFSGGQQAWARNKSGVEPGESNCLLGTRGDDLKLKGLDRGDSSSYRHLRNWMLISTFIKNNLTTKEVKHSL